NFQVMSNALTRTGNPIDSVLRIFNDAGQLLATNDDDFESRDSSIVDFVLPADATGRYFVEVDTFTPDGIVDSDVGQYELFMYRFGTGATSLGGGDTIIGGSGNDTMVGGSGNDAFRFDPGATGTAAIDGGSGLNTLDMTGAPGMVIVSIKGNFVAVPTTTSISAPAVTYGPDGLVTLTGSPVRSTGSRSPRRDVRPGA